MAREYISVDRHDRDTSQIVNLTNTGNNFTGEFFVPMEDGTTKNIRELVGGQTPGSQVFQVEFTKNSVDHDDIFGKLLQQNVTIRPGDIIICKRHFTENEKNYTAVATYVVIGSDGNYELLPVSPSKIQGGMKGTIQAVLDENGDSVFKIDEIEFEELHADELYIEGKEIRTLLPNLSGLKNLQKLKNPNKMKDISDKVNELIDFLKGAANAQHL